MIQKEEIDRLRSEAAAFLQNELSSQQGFLQKFRVLRDSFVEHGLSTSVFDSAITGWESNTVKIQNCIEDLKKPIEF